MNNPTSPIRRPFAGLDTDPWGPIENIKSLLDDVYRYDADGRTIVRELFQNADDAGAGTLVFAIAEKGLEGASNPLLGCAALVIVNDGPFPEKDHDGLHRAIGGAKRDDAAKVGRFGLGLKSLFHLCEAFIYLGRDDQESGRACVGALNPWAGTDPVKPKADPRYPAWDIVTDDDYQLLAELGERLLPEFARAGLLLWVPLRRVTDHLDRGQKAGEPYGISTREVRADDLRRWFADETPLALLLAQAGAVHRVIACVTPPTPQEDVTQTLRDISRTPTTNDQGEVWLGRPILDSGGCEPLRRFQGKAATDSRTWVINGSVVRGDGVLDRVRQRSDWPIDRISLNGRNKDQPRKAAGHASVVLVRPTGADSAPSFVRIRWCVFFPLDDSSAVDSTSPLVETKATGIAGRAAWDVLLHGYFWPAQDRRSIPGVVETGERRQDLDADDVRVALNRAVSDNLLLPMIPQALEASLDGLEAIWANGVVGAVLDSSLGRERIDSVCRDRYLVPVLESATTWKATPRDRRLIALAGWDGAPDNVRRHLSGQVSARRSDTVLIDGDAKRLGGVPRLWSTEEVNGLLELVPEDLLRKGQVQEWLERALRTASDSATGCLQGTVAEIFAEWLGRSLGRCLGGALLEPRALDAWRRLFDLVPSSWRVPVPRGARRAVAELAGKGLFGRGLMAMPIGLDAHQRREQGGGPDQGRLELALKFLGSQLSKATEPQDSTKARQDSTKARIVLAECLLAELVDVEARERVSHLPLLRAHRLPEGRDEAWSLADLRRGAGCARVFRSEVSTTTDADPDVDVDAPPNDRVKRVKALAQALGEPCWLVRTGVEHDISLAHPTDADLAAALVRGDGPLAEEGHRRDLLVYFRSLKVAQSAVGLQAIRALLTGERKCSDDRPLYYVPTAGAGNSDTETAAKLLLRLEGRPWALFPSSMTDLPHVVLQTVDAHHPIDSEALHILLARVLKAAHALWANLCVSEMVLLLKVLHPGISAPDKATRWRNMPLHRRGDGTRGPITNLTFTLVAGVDLPADIQASVVLLTPDEELQRYYADIPDLDRVHALRLVLDSSAPQDYASYILRLLFVEGQEGVLLLPPPVRDRLRSTAWIPLEPSSVRPHAGSPDLLLLVPRAVEDELESMIKAGSFRPRFFPKEVPQHLRDDVVAVARGLRANPGEPGQVKALAEAVRTSRTGQQTFAGLNLAPMLLTEEILWAGLDTPIAEHDPGWRLVRRCRGACGPLNDDAKDAIKTLAGELVGPVPAERQVDMLRALSELEPGVESPEGKVHKGILSVLAPLAAEVVAQLHLPVQDGTWKPARAIARSASGLAGCHLLRGDLRKTLGLDDHTGPSRSLHRAASPAADTSSAGDLLRRYFEDWQGRVKPGVVGAFLALLGDYQPGGSVEALALEWLTWDPSLRDVSVRDLRERLRGGTWPVVPPPKVAAAFSEGDTVMATNLVGEDFEASAAGTEVTSIFSQDPVHTYHYGLQVWDIRLRKVDPRTQSPAQLGNLVSAALQWWCRHALRVPLGHISEVVKLAEGSQLAVEPVRACILASLPLTLRQLNVNEHRPLMGALRTAESAQRRRAQAPLAGMTAAAGAEREALELLGKTITESTAHDAFLRARVRERIAAFGYGVASTLLELSQNADDALAQLEEMLGSLPDAARTLTVRVHAMENGTTVDVVHFGRPINETGGAAFPAGVDRQWDMDLYFMMLMNLSAKPGEAAGGALGTAPTTGKFGLGFKSVHLVSDLPEVVSGFLSFEVAAGLLPEASPRPDDPALKPIGGCYPTRIRLPLRQCPQTTTLLEELFARFGVARAILPAFSRAIRKIVVEGGPSSGVTEYNGGPLVAGWSVSSDTVALGDERGWKLLRFAMRDCGAAQDSAAVLLGVRDGQVKALPDSVPFLWNVTPTGEAWNIGYSVNGPVKLDPGRAHADLDNEETKRVFARLGESLGTALIELDDRLTADDQAMLEPLGVDPRGADAFRQSLWSQLSRGLAADDRKRTALLRQLHGPNRGLYAWMAKRSIAPTGLPAPFASSLPAGVPRELQVATGALEDPDVCAALALIDGLSDTLAALPAVSPEIAGVVRSISPECRVTVLGIGDILATTVTLWKQQLTPARLLSVQALTTDPMHMMVRSEGSGDWGSALRAQAADGSWQSLRRLLIPERDREVRSGGDEGSPPLLDESLRADIAPKNALLSGDFLVDDAVVAAFRRLRTRHEVDAEVLWDWVCEATTERHAPALRYLAVGELRGSLLEKAVNADHRPAWLTNFDYVCTLLESAQVRPHEANQVLVTLFPDHVLVPRGPTPPPPPPPPPEPLPIETARQLVRDLYDQWCDADYRACAVSAWRDRWYPSGWSDDRLLRALREHPCDDDESQTAWMIMFTLATTQGLGRTQPEQHRGFVEALMSRKFENGRSWWSHLFERFDDRSNKDTWFAFLEGWADARVGGRTTYDHWLTTLPELFAAWRWLPDYRDLVVATGRMESGSLVLLLRPRVDPEQDRGGVDAPPLPVVRHQWLLSELLRLGVLHPTPPLREAAWPPSRALEVVIQLLGLDVCRGSQAFSRRVFTFMAELLGPGRDPTFFNCFDKPLLSGSFRQSLERACLTAGLDSPAKEDLDDVGAGWMGDAPDEDTFRGGEE
jgi:hypothetical protein